MTIPSLGANAWLTDVSCSAPGACVAVGTGPVAGTNLPSGDPITLHLTGTTWTNLASPTNAGGVRRTLYGVTCVSAQSCVAVGSNTYVPSNVGVLVSVLIETWDGTTWTEVSDPFMPYLPSGTLSGVACSGGMCTAVGGDSFSLVPGTMMTGPQP